MGWLRKDTNSTLERKKKKKKKKKSSYGKLNDYFLASVWKRLTCFLLLLMSCEEDHSLHSGFEAPVSAQVHDDKAQIHKFNSHSQRNMGREWYHWTNTNCKKRKNIFSYGEFFYYFIMTGYPKWERERERERAINSLLCKRKHHVHSNITQRRFVTSHGLPSGLAVH